jgi:hypothetical protein
MTPSGIEPATFRLIAQHFNHCATVVPGLNITNGNYEDSTVTQIRLQQNINSNNNYFTVIIIIIIIIISTLNAGLFVA